jgi:hypothetical protein
MMPNRVMDYDATIAEQRARFSDLKARMGYRRGSRNRLRDPEERRSLMQLDLARLKAMELAGERRRSGRRTIIVKL